ncbi:MAG: hypothetical protein EHM89_00035 [Acidobacteria bacterium]|nr:MAG: hypothetical protein EHM89_00035 [Acidobacteriota bacterium]
MTKKTKIALGVFGAGLVGGVALAMFNDMTATREPTATERLRRLAEDGPYVDVTMFELAKAYDENQVSADGRYRGRALRVAGSVSAVLRDRDGAPLVFLGSSRNRNLVGCAGVDEHTAARQEPGDGVVMKGVSVGSQSGMPMMLFCSIEMAR